MPVKRVCLIATDTVNYGSEYNITVDLFLTEDDVASDKMTAFGTRGGLAYTSRNIEPFLLFKDGVLDFGSEWDAEDRDFHLNLRGEGRKILSGELFTFRSSKEEVIYRVSQVVDLQ